MKKNIDHNKWYNMWKNQSSPLSREVDPDYRSQFAKEIILLLGDVSGKKVLEFGCGDGLMFESYGFHKSDYTGVDFSDSLLEKFKSHYPDAKLEKCSAENFTSNQKFDIVFSCGMVQYLSPKLFEEHIGNIKQILSEGGTAIFASILWKDAKLSYFRNETSKEEERSLLKFILVYLKHGIKNRMGYWYNMRCLKTMAKKNNFDFTFYGSLHYPYRIHMVLK